MQPFEYHVPSTVAEVKSLNRGEAKLMAGGQSLLGAMKLGLASPTDIVDLRKVAALKGISVDDGVLTIGAMVTHAEVASSSDVRHAIAALADLAEHIGDRQVRHRGTLGGSLANNDPAACYPAAVLALDATIVTDRREISATAFFVGFYETALEQGELITAVRFPVAKRAAYEKFKQPASRFPLVGVFVAQTAQGARVAVTGAGPSVFRVAVLEARLSANWSAVACEEVSVDAAPLNNDLHASAAYRAALIPVLAARAVAKS